MRLWACATYSAALALVVLLAIGCNSAADSTLPSNFPRESPVNDLLGNGPGFDQQAALDRDLTIMQDLTGDCMRALGWEYFEFGAPTGLFVDATPKAPPDTFDGYLQGIAVNGWGVIGQAPDAGFVGNDPNLDYANGLEPATRTAYLRDLHGPATFEEDPHAVEELGCQNKALFEIAGNPLEDEISLLLAELEQGVLTNDKHVEAIEDWRRCVSDEGYGFLVSPFDPSFDFETWFSENSERDPEDPTYLDELRSASVDAALDVAGCDYSYRVRAWAVRIEQENDFLSVHGDRLALLLAQE